jgi:hypothetical protein
MIYLRAGVYAEGPTDYDFLLTLLDRLLDSIGCKSLLTLCREPGFHAKTAKYAKRSLRTLRSLREISGDQDATAVANRDLHLIQILAALRELGQLHGAA